MTRPRCNQLRNDGEPCRNFAMTGSDRCASHLSRTGRKSSLTPEVSGQLLAMLRAGNYLRVALLAVGVPRRTFRDWMERGKSEEVGDAPYRELREQIESARAAGEARNVAAIANAAREGTWQAAAWLLERQYPERWGRVSVRLRDEPEPEPVAAIAPEDDPFAEVDELAARRRERAG